MTILGFFLQFPPPFSCGVCFGLPTGTGAGFPALNFSLNVPGQQSFALGLHVHVEGGGHLRTHPPTLLRKYPWTSMQQGMPHQAFVVGLGGWVGSTLPPSHNPPPTRLPLLPPTPSPLRRCTAGGPAARSRRASCLPELARQRRKQCPSPYVVCGLGVGWVPHYVSSDNSPDGCVVRKVILVKAFRPATNFGLLR